MTCLCGCNQTPKTKGSLYCLGHISNTEKGKSRLGIISRNGHLKAGHKLHDKDEFILCKCGCGQVPKERGRLYCQGHHTRIWNPSINRKGKTWEEFYGKEFLKTHQSPMKNPEVAARVGASMRGEKSPAWLGGISKLPYPFNFDEELKELVKKRDDYTCQFCSSKEKLAVHHIDYIKENINPSNLITLCNSCHSIANFNRPSWTSYFQTTVSIVSEITGPGYFNIRFN